MRNRKEIPRLPATYIAGAVIKIEATGGKARGGDDKRVADPSLCCMLPRRAGLTDLKWPVTLSGEGQGQGQEEEGDHPEAILPAWGQEPAG